MENYWKIAKVLKAFHFRIWGAILWDAQKQCSCLWSLPLTLNSAELHTQGQQLHFQVCFQCISVQRAPDFMFHQGYVRTWRDGEGFMLVRSLPSSLRKGDGPGDLLACVCEKTQGKEWGMARSRAAADWVIHVIASLSSTLWYRDGSFYVPWGAQILHQT